jgi:hypothetical protein
MGRSQWKVFKSKMSTVDEWIAASGSGSGKGKGKGRKK